MTKLTKCLLAAAFAVAVAGTAEAQRGGGGGGGGQRQPGGQGGRGGFQQSLYLTMLTNADLQKELKITDDQKKGLKDVTAKAEELNKKMQEMRGGGGGGGREGFQAIMEERTKLTEEAKAAAEKNLSEDQKKRVKQIEVQAMGLRAFTNEDVQKSLKISDDQKAKLKTMGEEVQKELGDLGREYGFGGGGGGQRPDPEKMAEFQKKSKALTDEALEKVKKELSDDQKKAWKELTGEPFDVSKLQPQQRRRDN